MKYLGMLNRVNWQKVAFGFLCLDFLTGNVKVARLFGTSENTYHSTQGQMSHIKFHKFLGQLMINYKSIFHSNDSINHF